MTQQSQSQPQHHTLVVETPRSSHTTITTAESSKIKEAIALYLAAHHTQFTRHRDRTLDTLVRARDELENGGLIHDRLLKLEESRALGVLFREAVVRW